MSTRRHTAYNIAGAIAPLVLMLLTVPLYIGLVGEARYGVLAIVWLLTGYFGFFDLGLGRATAYALSRAENEQGDAGERRARIFWTAVLINLALGVIGGAVLLAALWPLFNHVFNVPPDLLAEMRPVIGWLSLTIVLLTMEGVFTGALTGREKFLALNVRAILGNAITQIVPLACVWYFAPTLTVAIPATIAARAVSVAIFALVAFRAVPAGLRPRPGGMAMARELLGYGGWIGLSSLVRPLIAGADRFLIAAFMNPVAVAFYAVPFQLVTRGGVFSQALANALFPRLARASAEDSRLLAARAMRANAALMTVLCATGIVIMHPFLALWFDPRFAANSAAVGEQLVLSTWLTALAVIPFNLLQAQGRPKETLVIMLIQLVPYLILGVIGVTVMGIVGVALARNVRSLINLVLLAARTQMIAMVMQIIAAPLLVLCSIIVVLRYLPLAGTAQAGIAAALWLMAAVLAYRMFPEGAAMARDLFRKALAGRA